MLAVQWLLADHFGPLHVSGVSALIAPVEVVVDPVRVLKLELDALSLDVERALATVAPLPDEPRLEFDGDVVVFASDGVLQRVPIARPTPGTSIELWRPASLTLISDRTSPATS